MHRRVQPPRHGVAPSVTGPPSPTPGQIGENRGSLTCLNIALFGEYGFMHFSPDLQFGANTLRTDLNTHNVVFGISLRH